MRDKAALLGQALGVAPYDALIDEFTPGLRTTEIDVIFKALSRRLPTLIRTAIERQASVEVLPITGRFSSGKQRQLITDVMKAWVSVDRGRLDESGILFTRGVSGALRQTRLDNSDVFPGLLRRCTRRTCVMTSGCRSSGLAARGRDRGPEKEKGSR